MKKPIFSNKRMFDYIEENIQHFQLLCKRIHTQTIHPLVDQINFDGPTLTKEKEAYAKKVISFFPINSLKRNHCKKISFFNTIWFKKDSTPENIDVVEKREEAESIFSLPCGRSTWMQYPNLNAYEQRIELYDYPSEVSKPVVDVYFAYVIIHEFAHTLQKAAYYWRHHALNILHLSEQVEPTYLLCINENKVDPKAWQEEFLGKALELSPITEYSAVYKDVPKDTRLHEYMADYISTYIMGVAMDTTSDDPWRGLSDRPHLKKLIQSFLEAEAEIKYG